MFEIIEEVPWLTIIGLGEDGWQGLSSASRVAVDAAELVTGSARHLALLPNLRVGRLEWPVPFAEGIPLLLAQRGRRVVMLASGDPFWFGAGSSVARHLGAHEWQALPGVSTFSIAAARLGWALEHVTCLGLHAAPLTRLRPHLCNGARVVLLLRDGAAVAALARYLVDTGFGASVMSVLEALGGPRERRRNVIASEFGLTDVCHPVAVALAVAGTGMALQRSAGLPDSVFEHDGQLTKQKVRALALCALAPRAGERLWDIGAGSGSIAIEWLLAHPRCEAVAVEADPERSVRLRGNADRLGVDRLVLVTGRAPEALADLPLPDAVFIGGGLSDELLIRLWHLLPAGCRVVAHAVTLESEALLGDWHARAGGSLVRIELAEAAPLGTRRAWRASYPIVQWSATR
jgi:precorrin-6Y C5,15-methyltransferase (decarboxylating)